MFVWFAALSVAHAAVPQVLVCARTTTDRQPCVGMPAGTTLAMHVPDARGRSELWFDVHTWWATPDQLMVGWSACAVVRRRLVCDSGASAADVGVDHHAGGDGLVRGVDVVWMPEPAASVRVEPS